MLQSSIQFDGHRNDIFCDVFTVALCFWARPCSHFCDVFVVLARRDTQPLIKSPRTTRCPYRDLRQTTISFAGLISYHADYAPAQLTKATLS